MSNMVLYGTQEVSFSFPNASETTQQALAPFSPPQGTQTILIYMQGFDIAYADNNQYGFGEFGVGMQVDGTSNMALCKASLRDNNENKRVWGGQAYGMVMFFGA